MPDPGVIADLKPYPVMKDSGLPWLGPVPEHWDLPPNRTLIRRRKALVGLRHSEYKLLSLTKQGVIVRDVESGKGKFSADMGTSQEVRTGDLVFCLFDVPETPRTVGLSRHHGMITGAYTVFECSDPVLSAYFELFYRAMDDRKLLSPLYSGLRNTIPPTRFLGTKTPLPPPAEQIAIVRFLNHAGQRIQRCIQAKQKLIKVLEEQKQAIIHRAVTRGLDPNARLKPSGVEWLGDIPKHWEVRRAKQLFREVDHRSTTGTEPLLSLRMYLGLVPHNDVSTVPVTANSLVGFKRVAAGQIVMNRMRAAIGMFGMAQQQGLVSPDYAVLEAIRSVDAEYYLRLFRTRAAGTIFRLESKGLGTGSSGFMRLYTDRFGIIKLPVPPQEEQRSIARGIAAETQDIESTERRVNREIALLREYWTRLTADVVTGKLDVRAEGARLPEEREQPAPMEELETLTVAGDDSAEDLGAVPEEDEV